MKRAATAAKKSFWGILPRVIGLAALTLLIVAIALAVWFYSPWRSGNGDQRPSQTQFVFDDANVLPSHSEFRINAALLDAHKQMRLDLVIITLAKAPKEPLSEWAQRRAEQWELGRASGGRRAMLLAIAPSAHQASLYVGEALVRIYPPEFITFINRQQFRTYFRPDRLPLGIERTAALLTRRARARQLLFTDTPVNGESTVANALPPMESLPAISNAASPLSVKTSALSALPSEEPDAKAYDAQPTPKEAWQTFLQACRWQQEPPLGIYDASANRLLKNQPPEQFSRLYQRYQDKRPLIRQDGNRAVAVFPNDPNRTLAPVFFRKTRVGWQLDGSMLMGAIDYNERGQWRFISPRQTYAFAFKDFAIDRFGYATYAPRKINDDSVSGPR
ncbi:MAG: TPM domain-containing protein [Vampirovibrionales bacterium]|nr:TPM domain-containing protein [Vampirovibrionales bacterium]